MTEQWPARLASIQGLDPYAWGTRYLLDPGEADPKEVSARPGILVCDPVWSNNYSYVTFAMQQRTSAPGSVELAAGAAGGRVLSYVNPLYLRHVPRPPPRMMTGTLAHTSTQDRVERLRENLRIALHDTSPKEGFLAELANTRNKELDQLTFPIYQRWDVIWIPAWHARWSPGPWLVLSNTEVNGRWNAPIFLAAPMELGVVANANEVGVQLTNPETERGEMYRLAFAGVRTMDLTLFFDRHNCYWPRRGGGIPTHRATYWLLPRSGRCLRCDEHVVNETFLAPDASLPWPSRIDSLPARERARAENLVDGYLGIQ